MLSSVTNVLLKVRQHAICHVIIVFFVDQSFLHIQLFHLASSEPGFKSRWYLYESLVVAGWTSGQYCSRAPAKVEPSCYARLSLEQGVSDVKLD